MANAVSPVITAPMFDVNPYLMPSDNPPGLLIYKLVDRWPSSPVLVELSRDALLEL